MNNKIIIGSIIVSGLILILGVFLLGQGTRSSQVIISSYSSTDQSKPKAQIDKSSADLGPMKVSDEKSIDFVIKNIGDKPLQITGLSTSCHCTAAKVIYEGIESQEYGMHATEATVISEISPSKQAIVRVTYRPFLMPVYGFVEREAYVETNDPQNSKITFRVTTNVK